MLQIDQSWTLFLDRDGVINREISGGYVLSWGDFHFLPGVPAAIALLGRVFGKLIVVSNQKCVGKGLITASQLGEIHSRMTRRIAAAGGRIDRVYFCPDLEEDSPCRKPNTGMGIQASRDFPEIAFSKSLLIGNKLSDMEFGRRMGMTNCFVRTTDPGFHLPHPWVDLVAEDLPGAIKALGLEDKRRSGSGNASGPGQ